MIKRKGEVLLFKGRMRDGTSYIFPAVDLEYWLYNYELRRVKTKNWEYLLGRPKSAPSPQLEIES